MSLTPTDLATLSRLLDEAFDLEPEKVTVWLEALPEEHAHLFPSLSEMLAEHASPGQPEFMSGGPKLGGEEVDRSLARSGELVGPYRLIRELGRGGMGEVWLAERADGSLKRKVALKLPRLAWGAGLAERMARERDIGALLEHPHIARLYDAGVDGQGRPYLALEYIDGQPIDAWCNANALSVRDRLKLFLQVTRAVAYAHGRLVVHRDLKPSNVLVTTDGETHLLDFGIAKLLDEAAADDRLTQEQGRVLTPHYASPEQLRGQTITVAADVYSLGVLLYELLTGGLPYALVRKSLAALEEAVLVGDPATGSSRAKNKATARVLRGELDAILAKALKRDPADRYATADAMAEDIERYLAGDTVRARPDSRWYRLRKSVVRYRGTYAAGIALTAVCVIGAAATWVQARRAIDQAERARIVTEFVSELFRANAYVSLRDPPAKSASPGQLLHRVAGLIEQRFANNAGVQTELYGAVARIYTDIGVGKLAVEYATRQLQMLQRAGAAPELQARALLLLADAHSEQSHFTAAEIHARAAVDLSNPPTEVGLQARAQLAGLLVSSGQHAEAKLIVANAEKLWPPSSSAASVGLAKLRSAKGSLLEVDNRFEETEVLWRAAISTAVDAEGASSRTANRIRLRLAAEEQSRNRLVESRAALNEALASLTAAGDAGRVQAALAEAGFVAHAFAMGQMAYPEARSRINGDRSTLMAWGSALPSHLLARVDVYQGYIALVHGDIDEANRLMRQAIPIAEEATDGVIDRRWLVSHQGLLAMVSGRPDEADAMLRKRLLLRVQAGDGKTPFAAYDWVWIAQNLLMQGDFEGATRQLDQAPTFATLQGDRQSRGDAYSHAVAEERVKIHLARGDAKAALLALPAPYGLEAIEDRTVTTLAPYATRGEVLCANGQAAAGLPIIEESIQSIAVVASANEPGLARLRAIAGLCALALGREDLARQWAQLANEAFIAQPGVSPWYRKPLASLQSALTRRTPLSPGVRLKAGG